LESEFKNISPADSFETANLMDSYSSESRIRRRQNIVAQQMSKSDNMAKSIAAFTNHANSAVSNEDEFEKWERCPIENLTHYFEQYEHENAHHEEDCDVPLKDQFASTWNSSLGVIRKKVS
jgi:hypothetical protein